MRRVVQYIWTVCAITVLVAALGACSSRKTIPDRKLREIFKEVFVANAYVQTENSLNPALDSLDIYRPILGRYGYTIRDLEHTLDNFSRRKSVRITTVVDQVVRELEQEESSLRYRASLLDSIDVRAQRYFGRPVLADSSLHARRISDTANLLVTVPVTEGIYEISYSYHIDSLDTNRGLKTTYAVTDTRGNTTSTTNTWMSTRRRTRIDVKITPEDGDSLLTIRFGNYPQDLSTPNISIDSLNIFYKPSLEIAIDSLDRQKLRYRNDIGRWTR